LGEKVGKNPTGRGKTGTKRSVLTDSEGVPIGRAIDGAHRHDFKMMRETIESIVVEWPDATPYAPQGLCLDKDDDYDEVREFLDGFGFTARIQARGEEAQALKQEAGLKAQRWVVERTHNWMNRFRRVLICWDNKARTTWSPCIQSTSTSYISRLAYWDRLLAISCGVRGSLHAICGFCTTTITLGVTPAGLSGLTGGCRG
jgi:Transposase DDE domain